jgi:flagellar biogenesis protein FliO
MNMTPESISLFSFLPIIIFFINLLIALAIAIFLIIMLVRFVKAHEKIAEQLSSISEYIKSLKSDKIS